MESGLEDVWEARRSERFRSDMAVQALHIRLRKTYF